ncbi:MAG: type II secretion system F family protein, partial [Candidatus Marithrix sp.]|nr:type II secretion system F family protein [Candidatus Marithrix sp.]
MQYKYQAIDNQKQEVTGILTADTEREAARQLKQRDLTPINISMTSKVKVKIKNKPKQRDVLVVLHELATLLESGVALIEAVESLADSSHHPFITQTFADIASQLRQGKSFSTTLQACPLELPRYVNQLVEAGELTGKIAIALRDGVDQMEYDAQVANEIRNAMIYPIILIVSGIGAVLMIFTIVVPRFAGMLKGRGDDIPMLAQMVLGTGMFLNNNFDLFIGGLVVLLVIIAYVVSQPNLRSKIKNTTAKLPLLGVWMLEAEAARWSAMLGTLLENKVSLLKALELAKQGIKLPSLSAKLAQVNKAVKA